VAITALVVALSGSAIAATVVIKKSSQLGRGVVGNKQLKKNAVTTTKVKNGTLLNTDFKAGQIPGQGIQGIQGVKGDTGGRGPSDAFKIGTGTSAGSDPPMDLAVPAGDYFVIAKVVTSGGTGGATRCDLTGGTNSDATFGDIEPAGAANHTQETLTSTMVTHFDAPGNIHWSCNLGAATPGEAVINAVQVGAVH
jgi:hypothetical protein